MMDDSIVQDISQLLIDAYPGMFHNTTQEQCAENITKTHSRADVNYYGAFKSDALVGSFNIWDFDMNLRGMMVKAGGIGSIAVDLCHKKEKVCREIMRFFFDTLCKNGTNVALLYPFNSAFYHRMGYGFGTLLGQYRVKPDDLTGGNSKSHIVRLYEENAEMLAEFYNSRVKSTHGLITKRADEFRTRLKAPANKVFAYVDNGVRGYIVFQFRKGSEENSLVNDIFVTELLFDSPEVFHELMTFVKSQSDQIRYIIVNTQDEGFINTIPDPRNHMERMLFPVYQEVCRTGLGIMYRICYVEAFFADIVGCHFGDLNMTLRVNIRDSFIAGNNRPFILKFSDGLCTLIADARPDVELCIDIAEFSSLIMGTVGLTSLVKYGKAQISDASHLSAINRAFAVDEKPVCLTYF